MFTVTFFNFSAEKGKVRSSKKGWVRYFSTLSIWKNRDQRKPKAYVLWQYLMRTVIVF